jgi:hypothetical protein
MNCFSFMRTFLLGTVLLFCVHGCNENPTGPVADPKPVFLSGGALHGTWLSLTSGTDSLKISFDSTQMRFIDQIPYDYGLRREFSGIYSLTSMDLYLSYDYGSSQRFLYHIDNNTFVRTDSLSANRVEYGRMSAWPRNDGWSKKLSIASEYVLYEIPMQIQSHAYSDSGPIALIATINGNITPCLMKFDIAGATYLDSAPDIRAIDARGRFLWLVTDSTVIKRTISDATVLSSFNYRSSVSTSKRATGFVVDSNYCLLNLQGILLKFTLDGVLLSTTQTSSVFMDLCLVDGRLFCLAGGETFAELNPSTGSVITNYNIDGRTFGDNIAGIASTGTIIQLVSYTPGGYLRLLNVDLSWY